MIFYHTVGGDRVRVVALPRYTQRAFDEWNKFVESDPLGIYGMDVESTRIHKKELGAFDRNIKTRLIQFGTHHEAWVLDPHSKWRPHILAFLSRRNRRFVSHNASFDVTRVSTEFGIELGQRSIDTLPMAALCHPGQAHTVRHVMRTPSSKGLKDLADFYIDNGLSTAEVELHARFADDFYASKERKTPLLPKSFEAGVSPCRAAKCHAISDPISRCGYCRGHYTNRKVNETINGWGWDNIDITDPAYLAYAGLDAVYCRRLMGILLDRLKRHGMRDLHKTEQRVKRLSVGVSRRGHKVDVEYTKALRDEVAIEFDIAQARVAEITGGIVAGSPVKLKEWLRKDFNLEVEKLDKEALPVLLMQAQSPAEETVSGELVPFFEQMLEVSQRKNILNNLRTIYTHATHPGGDGCAHPNINTLQAHTGRQSYTAPAMQTFKKTDKRLRRCFVARDGHVLIGADYNSQEIRIAAALSRDPALLKIVREGLNQHVLTAIALFPDTIGPLFALCRYGGCGECTECTRAKSTYPGEYAAAKVLDFAQQYGAGPKKIALQLGIPYEQARTMWEAWRETYAGLVAWTEELAQHAMVTNPFGREIPRTWTFRKANPNVFPPIRPGWVHRGYANGNYIIQSSGRDVLGRALENLEDSGYGENIWLTVHDEIVMEVPEEGWERDARRLGECMTVMFGDIEIPAEGELIGTRWGGDFALAA